MFSLKLQHFCHILLKIEEKKQKEKKMILYFLESNDCDFNRCLGGMYLNLVIYPNNELLREKFVDLQPDRDQ